MSSAGPKKPLGLRKLLVEWPADDTQLLLTLPPVDMADAEGEAQSEDEDKKSSSSSSRSSDAEE